MRAFNDEDVIEYAHHILALAKNETKIDPSKTYLVSCNAHTMKRFSKSIVKYCLDTNVLISKDKHRHACLCFSLLLNSRDLEMLTTCFTMLCTIYLSKNKNELYLKADSQVKALLDARPTDNEDLQVIIRYAYQSYMMEQQHTAASTEKSSVISDNETLGQATATQSVEIEIDNNELESYDQIIEVNDQELEICDRDHISSASDKNKSSTTKIPDLSDGKTIRDRSPFTLIFEKIFEEVFNEIELLNEQNNNEKNYKYNPGLIDFILKKFMPYAFVWSSPAFQGLEQTRMTNGRGEKHNQFSKGIGTRMAPANYSNQALVIANGSAIQYKKDLSNNNSQQKKQASKAIEDNDDIYDCQETYYKVNSGVAKPTTYQSSTLYKSPDKKLLKEKSAKIKNATASNKSKHIINYLISLKLTIIFYFFLFFF